MRFIYKEAGRKWPKVAWGDSRIVLFYLGVEPDDVTVEEAQEVDFEALLLRLDTGGSVLMTLRQENEGFQRKTEVSNEWL
jgi:hypothetical protein